MEFIERKKENKHIRQDCSCSPNLKGKFMITLYVEDLNTEITQDVYDDYINAIDIHTLECTCKRHDMVIHGYYTRKLKIHNKTITLTILRVRCTHCNKTHAVLLSLIVPYQNVALNIQIEVLQDEDVEDILINNPDIDIQTVNRIRKRYRSYFKTWVTLKRLLLDSTISIKAYRDFVSNFMQIHKGRYILNLLTT